MQLNRDDMFYFRGILAERFRERTSNVPLRYKTSWKISHVIVLKPSEISLHDQHTVITDDLGARVIYTYVEELGSGLTKRQAEVAMGSGLQSKRSKGEPHSMLPKLSTLTCCPHCEHDEFEVRYEYSGTGKIHRRFDRTDTVGTGPDNSGMYDDLVMKPGLVAYCSQCGVPIAQYEGECE